MAGFVEEALRHVRLEHERPLSDGVAGAVGVNEVLDPLRVDNAAVEAVRRSPLAITEDRAGRACVFGYTYSALARRGTDLSRPQWIRIRVTNEMNVHPKCHLPIEAYVYAVSYIGHRIEWIERSHPKNLLDDAARRNDQ